MAKKIYIIGAGISGLVAAYYLQKKDYEVEIFEAAKQSGGRCRSYYEPALNQVIDNGNHLILGANTNTIRLIKELKAFSLFNKFPAGFNFYNDANSAFQKLNTCFAGFKLSERLRFLFKIFFPKNRTVEKHFIKCGEFYQGIIKNISISILNTPPDLADSKIFSALMRKLLANPFLNLRYYYPKTNWNDAFISKLAGGLKINYGMSLKAALLEGGIAKTLIFPEDIIRVSDAVVIFATPLAITNEILKLGVDEKYNHIINIHFKLLSHELPAGIYGFSNEVVDWIFVKDNVISTTKSAANNIKLSEEELVYKSWALCKKISPQLHHYEAYKIINEKRATFSCEQGFLTSRPIAVTKYKNLFLTGDYVQNNLPATIEGAVINGKNLANYIAKNL